jgi:hypothetical protein
MIRRDDTSSILHMEWSVNFIIYDDVMTFIIIIGSPTGEIHVSFQFSRCNLFKTFFCHSITFYYT